MDIEELMGVWREGRRWGFPPCCRLRFYVQVQMDRVLPPVLTRAASLSPRRALADGYVPCEYHALKWVLTGKPSVDPASRVEHFTENAMCCVNRAHNEDFLIRPFMEFVTEVYGTGNFDSEPVIGDGFGAELDMLLWYVVNREGVQVFGPIECCPWCGAPL